MLVVLLGHVGFRLIFQESSRRWEAIVEQSFEPVSYLSVSASTLIEKGPARGETHLAALEVLGYLPQIFVHQHHLETTIDDSPFTSMGRE